MKTLTIILSTLLLAGCSRENTQPAKVFGDTNAADIIIEDTTPVPSPPANTLPSWYVFKIKQFRSVTHSEDNTSAIIEGVTMQDKEFKIKVVWDAVFDGAHRKSVDAWIKRSETQFQAGIPYIIAGEVISRDPLTLKPDTVTPNGDKFGAPPESVY